METHNAIIIDDEANTRAIIADVIRAECPEIHICGSVGSAPEGRQLLHEYKVDIIFLDIALPNEDGFEFLATIQKEKYSIIFITAYQEFALRALKASAIDYLLKPIDPLELRNAVSKAREYQRMRISNSLVQETYFESLKNLQSAIHTKEKTISTITVSEQFGFKMITLSDLMYLDADGNYTLLYMADGTKILATKNIGEFEKILDPMLFYRIHKSSLVNVRYIAGFTSNEGNFAELKNGTKLIVSRRKLLEFREWLKHYSIPVE